jgi:hypothetical protein
MDDKKEFIEEWHEETPNNTTNLTTKKRHRDNTDKPNVIIEVSDAFDLTDEQKKKCNIP